MFKFILIIFIFQNLLVVGQNIEFSREEFKSIFSKAKIEEKNIMLFFHFDGCGACSRMEKNVFIDSNVFNIVNKEFISYEINSLKGEGINLSKNYNVNLHPTFIFLNSDNQIIHKIVGYYNSNQFITEISKILNASETISELEKVYFEKQNDPDFLYNYCYQKYKANEIDSFLINKYLNLLDTSNYDEEKNLRFIYDFCLLEFKNTISFEHPAFQNYLKNINKLDSFSGANQGTARSIWFISNEIEIAINQNKFEYFQLLLEELSKLETFQYIHLKNNEGDLIGVIFRKHLVLWAIKDYYKVNGDENEYNTAIQSLANAIWLDDEELNELIMEICLQPVSSKKELKIAYKCSKQSLKIDDNYQNNDTHSRILFRLNKIKKSIKYANKAIIIAKKNNQEFDETLLFLNDIKK